MIDIDKIYNEDCLEGMKRIADGAVDCIITDLPYGTTACAWDSVIPFEPLWEQFKRVTKPNAAIVLFGSQPFTSTLVMSNPTWFKHEWIWQKNRGSNFGTVKFGPMREHENILVFSKGRVTYNPQMQERAEGGKDRRKYDVQFSSSSTNYAESLRKNIGRYELSELRQPSSVQFFLTSSGDDHKHPTQKPVDLLRYLILTYSNEGDTILDATIGSGTTAVAALMEKRHFIGFETNKEYFDIAQGRIDQVRRNPTLF